MTNIVNSGNNINQNRAGHKCQFKVTESSASVKHNYQKIGRSPLINELGTKRDNNTSK